MATYEEIYGKRVKEFDSDPTLESSYEGQVWYDKSSGVLKSVVNFSAYSSTSPLNTGRRATGGTGTQTAALVCSGQISAPTNSSATEEYNGTGYSVGGNTGTARYTMACGGTQTAGIISMGYSSSALTATEEYNGSTWTSGTASNDNRTNLGSGGTQSSFLAFGGSESPGTSAATEEWDDSSWTTGGNLGTARYQLSGNNVGTQTAGLCAGGFSGGSKNLTEEYNGSTWSTGGALPTANGNAARGGTQTAAYFTGGSYSPNTASYHYDGTSWATAPSLGTGRSQISGSQATQTNHVVFGGGTSPTPFQASEEFNTSINTITPAAFASGGNLGTARYQLAGSGTETAALASGGGSLTTVTGDTEEYNGTSWAEQSNLSTARKQLSGGGPQTAAFVCGGFTSPPNTVYNQTEEYSGSSWTSGGAMSVPRRLFSSVGTQTAGLAIAGFNPPNAITTCEEYGGTSWTSGGGLSGSARYRNFSTGTQTAGLTFGGTDNPEAVIALTEEYDGSSWTAGGALNTVANGGAGSGVQTSALAFASSFPSSERYDGTSWATAPAPATPRTAAAGSNNATSNSVGLFFGGGPGNPPSNVNNNTESFTGETETVTFKTLTTS